MNRINRFITAVQADLPKYDKITPDEIAQIKQRVSQGQQQSLIAHEMGLPLSSVGYHARKVLKEKSTCSSTNTASGA